LDTAVLYNINTDPTTSDHIAEHLKDFALVQHIWKANIRSQSEPDGLAESPFATSYRKAHTLYHIKSKFWGQLFDPTPCDFTPQWIERNQGRGRYGMEEELKRLKKVRLEHIQVLDAEWVSE
jgi:hypothetical protein